MWDTIAAIATGNVLSAIGIIRISGPEAISIAGQVFKEKRGRSTLDFENRKLYYGQLQDAAGQVLDHCLCTVSRGPDSYTGEDTAELQCHGSPMVLREGLKALFALGVRQAGAGEFTQRSFLNGKLDLTQAEAVIDLISAETREAAQNAAGQIGGAISGKIDGIYSGLTDILAHFHAVLDYPDEDIEPFCMEGYSETLRGSATALEQLAATFRRGEIMTQGIRAAIVGKPNAGKSSLLNALLGYERAIVTEIPGTTRDTLEERVCLGGVLLRLMDTAGLRQTADPVEQIGVHRAVSAAGEAQLVLAVFDGSKPLEEEDREAIAAAENAPLSVAVINKADLPQALDVREIEGRFSRVCRISAIRRTGLDTLEAIVGKLFGQAAPVPAGEVLTNIRHVEAVSRAADCLKSARGAIDGGITPDAVVTELEGAMNALGELTGRTVREDVTARIFERFCVGK